MLKNLEIVEKAKGLWERSSPAELGLLEKVFSDVTLDKALDILEAAKLDSTYQSLPLKDIHRRARSCGSTGGLNGQYYDCWAVHQDTKKFKECAVLAEDKYGANVMMQKWLKNVCKVEPTDYVIFVGKENFRAFFNYRMCIEETVEVDDF